MSKKHMKFVSWRFTALLFLTLAGVPAPVMAADFAGVSPVSDAQLASLRGGFAIGDGDDSVWLSFSFDQLAYINGNLVATTHLTSLADAKVTVIQNGVDNHVRNTWPPDTFGTVIQNSLDSQVISNVNVFNMTVTSLRAAQWLSVQSTVQGALTR